MGLEQELEFDRKFQFVLVGTTSEKYANVYAARVECHSNTFICLFLGISKSGDSTTVSAQVVTVPDSRGPALSARRASSRAHESDLCGVATAPCVRPLVETQRGSRCRTGSCSTSLAVRQGHRVLDLSRR